MSTCNIVGCPTHSNCESSTAEDGTITYSCTYATGYNADGTCANGYYSTGSSCQEATTCFGIIDACSTYGDCVPDQASGDHYCKCTTGFAGKNCELCDAGFVRDGTNCRNVKGCHASGFVIPSGAECHDNADGTTEVVCQTGRSWWQSTCVLSDSCAFQTTGACSSHGDCRLDNEEATCCCSAGYKGETCSECAEGYADHLGVCYPDNACLFPGHYCQNGGTCSICDQTTTCECAEGYAGVQCENCASGYHKTLNDGVSACVKNAETTTCDADHTEKWQVCYTKDSCNVVDQRCNEHGSCNICGNTGSCKCYKGYTGKYCANVLLNCPEGQHQEGDACVLDCNLQCAHGGTCTLTEGVQSCTCVEHWTGDLCEICDSELNVIINVDQCARKGSCGAIQCLNGGTCPDFDGICVCPTGFGGSDCSVCAEGYKSYSSDDGQLQCIENKCINASCAVNEVCQQVLPSTEASCVCAEGYKLDEGHCYPEGACIFEGHACPAHGVCTKHEDESTGYSTTCDCPAPYTGSLCNNCLEGYEKINGFCLLPGCRFVTPSCNNHGSCNPDYENLIFKCYCTEAGYTGEFCTECAEGYRKLGTKCYLNDSCVFDDVRPCSEGGTCEDLKEGEIPHCVCRGSVENPDCRNCGNGKHYVKNAEGNDWTCVADSLTLAKSVAIAGIAAALLVAIAIASVFIIRKIQQKKAMAKNETSLSSLANESVAAEN